MKTASYYLGRREIKYIVKYFDGLKILESLNNYLIFDPFMKTSDGYLVKSLYFDGVNMNDYFETVSGYINRKKLRIRTYGGFEDKVFAEIKYKYDKVTNKWRKPISKDIAKQLIEVDNVSILEVFSDTLAMDMIKQNYGPQLTVVYQRRAFVDRLGMGVRVTLDTNVRCAPADQYLKLGHDSQNCLRVLPPGYAVLEFKVKNRIPFWLHEIVIENNLRRTAYSKYVLSADRLLFRKPLLREDVEGG